jgi:single-strand DNA-binding protein
MANDINSVFMIGRLVKDPELRTTQSGAHVAGFTLANNRSYTVNGEKKDYVSFIPCVAWNKLGDVIVQYCAKGQRIGVEGRLQQRTWEKNGEKRYSFDVVVENFQFLDYKKKDELPVDPPASEVANPVPGEVTATDVAQMFGDIPF